MTANFSWHQRNRKSTMNTNLSIAAAIAQRKCLTFSLRCFSTSQSNSEDDHNWDSVGVTDSNFNKFRPLFVFLSASTSSTSVLIARRPRFAFRTSRCILNEPKWAQFHLQSLYCTTIHLMQKKFQRRWVEMADTKLFVPCVYSFYFVNQMGSFIEKSGFSLWGW